MDISELIYLVNIKMLNRPMGSSLAQGFAIALKGQNKKTQVLYSLIDAIFLSWFASEESFSL